MTSTLSREEIVALFKTFLDYQNTADWGDIHKHIQPTVELENGPLQRDAFIVRVRSVAEGRQQQSKLGNYVVNVGSQAIAAEVFNIDNDEENTAGENLGYREIAFVWFADGRLSKFKSLQDGHAQPLKSTFHQTTPAWHTPSSLDLRTYYYDYLSNINAGTIGQHPEKFLYPTIIHNNRAIEISGFVDWMNNSRKAVQSLHYEIKDLVVDGQSGQIAASLELSGLPVENWFGMEPNGKSVRFKEHAMYWFDKEKIKKIITVIDLDSFRRQLQASK